MNNDIEVKRYILLDVDIKDLFGNSYNDYLERRKTKLLKKLCIV